MARNLRKISRRHPELPLKAIGLMIGTAPECHLGKDRAGNKWRKLPACDAAKRKLEACATFRHDSNFPFDPKQGDFAAEPVAQASGLLWPEPFNLPWSY
ncbi:MAG: hypothetical protein RIK87_06895 [Fuerstiella sp.]